MCLPADPFSRRHSSRNRETGKPHYFDCSGLTVGRHRALCACPPRQALLESLPALTGLLRFSEWTDTTSVGSFIDRLPLTMIDEVSTPYRGIQSPIRFAVRRVGETMLGRRRSGSGPVRVTDAMTLDDARPFADKRRARTAPAALVDTT